MDRIEFSIAMHLIRAVLAGATLPPTLPVSLKVFYVTFFEISLWIDNQLKFRGNKIATKSNFLQSPMMMVPSFPPLIPHMPMVRPMMSYGVLPTTTQNLITSGKIQGDWTIPHHNKLKYCQQFNQLDKNRIGSLSGVHAR